MSFTNAMEDLILDHIFRKSLWTPPDNIQVGLYTASPGEAGDDTHEVDMLATSYVRQITLPGDWAVSSNGTIFNTAVVTFPEATEDWGTITHFGLLQLEVGPDLILIYGALANSRMILTGSVPRFNYGALGVSLT